MSINVGGVTVKTGLFIDGDWVKGNGEKLDTINPATEEVLGTIETATPEDVDSAVKAARKCFKTSWGTNVAAAERGRLLFALADKLEASTDELAILESLDAGKPLAWCKADISDAVACFRYFAGAADKIHGRIIEIDDTSKHCLARKEPIGVVAQIVPWNYPLLMMTWKLAPALATGCAIVFKAAEQTPLSTLKFAELFATIGYPAGALNFVNGLGRITGEAMASHKDIDKIAFTGSTATGRRIAVSAAQSNLKKVTLELGGKSANIVFSDADLKEAAKWAAFGIYENMGQSCTAGSRILVQDEIYDEFLGLFLDAVRAIKVGDPKDEDTFQGPQVSKLQFDKILQFIEDGKKDGAKVELGGKRHGDKGYFIAPTVFSGVDNKMRIAQEEIFGPVASLIRFKTEEEAIEIANESTYGLAAGVHTLNINRANRVVRQLQAGTVWVNQYVMLSHQAPFGGYKASGWGRELGVEGLEAYLATKTVHHYYGEPLEWPIKL